ncbi:LOW QUALITY PROTEIN: Hypothetical protein PHPALM_14041 [Phytophthora palmivora]|uniref:Uncharacterized protein n=1 Tax=Phytophthora palmivora TaxID=4796 RepID=A0A2P4XVR1_9STRA|nr:LOW QUALITY PROTEIN: Hypothetical protein PHPALM_14041 [Phytophthora palmivora]
MESSKKLDKYAFKRVTTKEYLFGYQFHVLGKLLTYALLATGYCHHCIAIAKLFEQGLGQSQHGQWRGEICVNDRAGYYCRFFLSVRFK